MSNIVQWTMDGSKQDTKGAKCPFIFSSSPRQVIQYEQFTYLSQMPTQEKREGKCVYRIYFMFVITFKHNLENSD